jgi:hypothetical protein
MMTRRSPHSATELTLKHPHFGQIISEERRLLDFVDAQMIIVHVLPASGGVIDQKRHSAVAAML